MAPKARLIALISVRPLGATANTAVTTSMEVREEALSGKASMHGRVNKTIEEITEAENGYHEGGEESGGGEWRSSTSC